MLTDSPPPDWIFSDEAHEWMDIQRKSHYLNPEHRTCGGYEYGLFGFKWNTCSDEHGACYHDASRNYLYSVRFEEIKLGDEKRML